MSPYRNPEDAKKWRQNHKEHIREYRKKFCEEHAVETKEYRKRYYAEHREKAIKYNRDLRHRDKILERFGRTCVRCGYSEFEPALDIHHLNGKDDDENVLLLCANCHRGLENGIWRLGDLD